MRLEIIHVISWVLLKGLKAHDPWISQPLKRLGHGYFRLTYSELILVENN